ncbi:hypothetical protein E2C01_027710 [Portunus trituberculatus]|uniref:Uncharacterized protein n=1 Tax=Portunus trituberculatus TaxID=210409 RepID=A0A5B7ELL6_PORTR|nr:hypothetical protein [Portunus trituberculatus]
MLSSGPCGVLSSQNAFPPLPPVLQAMREAVTCSIGKEMSRCRMMMRKRKIEKKKNQEAIRVVSDPVHLSAKVTQLGVVTTERCLPVRCEYASLGLRSGSPEPEVSQRHTNSTIKEKELSAATTTLAHRYSSFDNNLAVARARRIWKQRHVRYGTLRAASNGNTFAAGIKHACHPKRKCHPHSSFMPFTKIKLPPYFSLLPLPPAHPAALPLLPIRGSLSTSSFPFPVTPHKTTIIGP